MIFNNYFIFWTLLLFIYSIFPLIMNKPAVLPRSVKSRHDERPPDKKEKRHNAKGSPCLMEIRRGFLICR